MKYNYNKLMRHKILKQNSVFSSFQITKMLMMIVMAFMLAAGSSCSNGKPQLLYGFMELVYYSGKDKPEERYSFFVLCNDDDGIENLSELYLYNDVAGLRWLITQDDWIKYEEDGKTWIGSRNIAMNEDAPLPRGVYRAVLVNKGGEQTERKFTFDGPDDPMYPFPFFSIADGMYRIDSKYPVNHLICYDQQGKPVQTLIVTDLQGNVSSLRLNNGVRTAALWSEDPEYHVSALTDAVSAR